MAWMPGARRRPITTRNYTRRNTTKDCVILHSTGSAAATSMYGWFNNPAAGVSSHFHVDNSGNIEQYVDTAHMSWANGAANSRSITIETQGNGYGPWTAAQIRSIVRIIQWVRSVHKGIPLRQMTSSAATQKGIGWHRLGVNGNFPSTGILRGRSQRGGGEKWSKAYGKICPGDDRIKQIPAIIRQAGGHTTPATASTSKGSWLDMVSKNELSNMLDEKLALAKWSYKGKEDRDAWSFLRRIDTNVRDLNDTVGRKVWSYKNHLTDTDIYAFVRATHRQVMAAQGEREGLMKAIEQISQGKEINLEEIRAAAEKGVSDALKSVEADVTLSVDAGGNE